MHVIDNKKDSLFSQTIVNYNGTFLYIENTINYIPSLQLPVQSVHITIKSRSWRGVLDTTLCDKVCQ